MRSRKLQLWLAACSLAVAVACIPQRSYGTLATLIDDTYVTQTSPTIFGKKAVLKVQSTPGKDSSVYLKFGLGTLPAGVAASDVDKATLTVFVHSLTGVGPVSVFEANPASFPNWVESTMNTTNAPVTEGAALQTVTPPVKFDYVTFDVTAAVLDWVATPGHNNGLVLTPGTGANLQFDSKESGATSHAPQLQIELKSAVTSANIVDGTIQGADIGASTINGSNIANNTVTSGNIQDGTITGTDIAASTITGSNIANGSIGNADLTNSSVTIAAGAGLSGGGTVSLGGTTTLTDAAIYGSGSAGDKTINANVTLSDSVLEYHNFTINAGFTLTVESGTIIRCTGSFINNGTIAIGTGASGANRTYQAIQASFETQFAPANPGISAAAAGFPETGNTAATRRGGLGGVGLTSFQARSILHPGPMAGGGGGVANSFFFAPGRGVSGGGSLVVLAIGGITNNGTISANGVAGSLFGNGGAGGGVIILASSTIVINSGTGAINAKGGDGGPSANPVGVGGGGGGGIIHIIAPAISSTGATSVTGGLSGTPGASGSITDAQRSGGGGGGASAGNGGNGGDVDTSGSPLAGGNGAAGYLLTTLTNPISLF